MTLTIRKSGQYGYPDVTRRSKTSRVRIVANEKGRVHTHHDGSRWTMNGGKEEKG